MLIAADEVQKGDVVWTDSTGDETVDGRWLQVAAVANNKVEVRVDFVGGTRPVFCDPKHGFSLKGVR